MNFKEYIIDIKSQLHCNVSEEFKNNYVTYNYTNEDIENNLTYFKACFDKNLSSYKALLFFKDNVINMKKRTKINFESINKGKYEIIPNEKIDESRKRIKESMKKILKGLKK
jgi:hypothetical protein